MIAPFIKKLTSKHFHLFFIFLCGSAVYANSLTGQFLWDDRWLIAQNPFITSGTYGAHFFTQDIGAGTGHIYHFYRPLVMLSFLLDYKLWGLNVIGYHLTNILLHIGTGMALYWCMRRLMRSAAVALMAALLFVTHPVHTEAVSYIANRGDMGAGLCMLLSFIWYVIFCDTSKKRFMVASVLSYGAALLCKEITVMLPVVLLMYHLVFRRKIPGRAYAVLCVMTVCYLAMRSQVLGVFISDTPATTTILERLPGVFAAVGTYARLFIWPFRMHMEYGKKLFLWSHPLVWAGITCLVLSLWYTEKKYKKHPASVFCLAWFWVTLLPVSNLYPLSAYMTEHWVYQPFLGLVGFSAYELVAFLSPRYTPRLTIGISCLLIGFFSVRTIQQNGYWSTPRVFYERTLQYAPESERMHIEMGLLYLQDREFEKGIQYIEQAVRINPGFAEAYNSLGAAYDQAGRSVEALEMFETAIRLDPAYAPAYNNIAIYYFYRKDYPRAIEYYNKAQRHGFVNPALRTALDQYRSK